MLQKQRGISMAGLEERIVELESRNRRLGRWLRIQTTGLVAIVGVTLLSGAQLPESRLGRLEEEVVKLQDNVSALQSNFTEGGSLKVKNAQVTEKLTVGYGGTQIDLTRDRIYMGHGGTGQYRWKPNRIPGLVLETNGSDKIWYSLKQGDYRRRSHLAGDQ